MRRNGTPLFRNACSHDSSLLDTQQTSPGRACDRDLSPVTYGQKSAGDLRCLSYITLDTNIYGLIRWLSHTVLAG